MKTSNLNTGNLNVAESGHLWVEQLTATMGTLLLKPRTIFRVKASGATTVTIDGVLAMTMASGEIEIFNAGKGDGSTNSFVTVIIAGANAYLQVSQEI